MADTTYPDFEQYSPIIAAYLRQFLKPYHDVLAAAETIESLTDWVQQVLPESSEELNAVIIQNGDVELGKVIILQTLANTLANPEYIIGTPWDISSNRNEIAVRLFGPSTSEIPIVVTHGNNMFVHELTEELAYGILIGLMGFPDFILSINGVPLSHEDLDQTFIEDDETIKSNYRALINGMTINFDTNEFIQGIITACDWTGANPHSIVTSLVQINEYEEEEPLNF